MSKEGRNFLLLSYRLSTENLPKTKTSEYYPVQTLNPDEWKKFPCLIETMKKGRTVIYVFANGKRSNPKKVVLIKSDYKAWDSILIHIGNILDIPEGVQGMYTVFGQPLCSPYEIQHGGYYVAIPFNDYFKAINYLKPKSKQGFYELSPMVKKEVYTSASKTCTMLDEITRKRRRSKSRQTKERPYTGEDNPEGIDQLERRVQIVATAAKMTEYPDQAKEERSTADHNKDEFTQTNTIYLEATYDTGCLFLNGRKYYLIPEGYLVKFSDADKSEWYAELFSDLYGKTQNENDEENREEIHAVAYAMVGFITNISERIANTTIYGKDEMKDIKPKYSFIADTIQPKTKQRSALRTKDSKTSQKSKEIDTVSTLSKDRSVCLAVPIGRSFEIAEQESSSSEEKLSVCVSALLDKEYAPLTPRNTITPGSKHLNFGPDENGRDLSDKPTSSLVKMLRKDSGVGASAIERYLKMKHDMKHIEDSDSDDDDEWRKLDILDDIGLTEEEEEQTESDVDSEVLIDKEELDEEGMASETENSSLENEENEDLVLNSHEKDDVGDARGELDELTVDIGVREHKCDIDECDKDFCQHCSLDDATDADKENEDLIYEGYGVISYNKGIDNVENDNELSNKQSIHSVAKKVSAVEPARNPSQNKRVENVVHLSANDETVEDGIKPGKSESKDKKKSGEGSDREFISLMLPHEDINAQNSQHTKLEFKSLGLDFDDTKPDSYGGSVENVEPSEEAKDRRMIMDLLRKSIELAFEKSNLSENEKAVGENNIGKGTSTENTQNSTGENIVDDRRRILSYLRMNIELALEKADSLQNQKILAQENVAKRTSTENTQNTTKGNNIEVQQMVMNVSGMKIEFALKQDNSSHNEENVDTENAQNSEKENNNEAEK